MAIATGTLIGLAIILGMLGSKIWGHYGSEMPKLKMQQKFAEQMGEKQRKSAATIQQRKEKAATIIQRRLAEQTRTALSAARQERSQQAAGALSAQMALMGSVGQEARPLLPPPMFAEPLAELRRQGLLGQ